METKTWLAVMASSSAYSPALPMSTPPGEETTFTVAPGTTLQEIERVGMTDHEPTCLVEGLRRVFDREVELHFHKVVPTKSLTGPT